MSISVYYGRAGSGKTRAVYERIRQVIIDCPGDPIILLVPEPATYRVERELANLCLREALLRFASLALVVWVTKYINP